MSNVLRNKQGNLSKVKYFLPPYRTEAPHPNPPKTSQVPMQRTRKQSSNKAHTRSLHEPSDLSFQIVGISEATQYHQSGKENKENIYSKGNSLAKRASIPKIFKAVQGGKTPQLSIVDGLSSIRALTNSREWKMPEGAEREQFLNFIQTLKVDETYQQTITMFTIMYFYERKKGKN